MAVLFAVGCDKNDSTTIYPEVTPVESEEKPNVFQAKGKIIGVLKCFESDVNGKRIDNTLVGLYIETEAKDLLLAFDVESSLFNLDVKSLEYGSWPTDHFKLIDNSHISFTYKEATGSDIRDYESPLMTAMWPMLPYPDSDFKQVVISDISKMQ